MFETSPTFRQLYDQAKHLKEEREAELMRLKQPDPNLSWDIDELTRTMNLLVLAFRKAVPEGAKNKLVEQRKPDMLTRPDSGQHS
ncbi:hypothetical protein GCM10028803_53080 [Larkinella knui]|uniref:Uncharacterized protein n=1 Tax=Larkinella knui TaxID=2025310 RepID=A0A3P1CHG5_9BACT|nr:hypothetical protein [Larkinella knui]RRB12486.1 hypothetical protein EHT87_20010 [Larkinella knui]